MDSTNIMALGIMAAFAVFASAVLVGILIIAYGQLMLAIREIALNTRKEESRNQYKILETVALLINLLGLLVIIGGGIVGIISIISAFNR